MTHVGVHMRRRIEALAPDDSLERAEAVMRMADVSHWPIQVQGRLVGMFSLHDLLDRHREDEGDGCIGEAGAVRPIVTQEEAPLLDAAELMQRFDVSCLPVVDGDQIIGVLTLPDIVRVDLGVLEQRHAPKVAELMTHAPLVTVGAHARAAEAEVLMRHAQVGHLPVVEGGDLIGIFTERDLVAVACRSLEPLEDILVGDLITRTEPVSPSDSAIEVGCALIEAHRSAVPVVARDQLVGILTRGDYLSHFIREAGGDPCPRSASQKEPDHRFGFRD